ncbi:HAMP domain-containing sensor histidine kinase [Luteimonas sp. M1R5S18]|uniref:histidine kinase n=1 Tax=Luteimonas rhizosphaericola TaxID=3042024 RepID=A0ABT6JNF6_9GAMM|nr:HAMP domain-containing sensor histidine kinase [Luteimonas rhizosphaericola]MDH5832223.1 HAMP domain-containing sensor histidine kinase [Luteimonas rhizosphaericola]
MPQGLPRRIRYAFVTQGLLLILAVVFGVSVVTLITRDALISQRLEVEAQAFWERRAGLRPPGQMPATNALQGYFRGQGEDEDAIPGFVRSLPEGMNYMYRLQRAILVQRRPDGVLYLVLQTRTVDRLMWSSAAAMILLGLLAALAITALTYRKSRGIVMPINRLAEEVSRWDPLQGEMSAPLAISAGAGDSGREVRALSSALHGLTSRVAEFIQRERDFTRDASHELRTPLTVIRVASDMLLSDPALPAHGRRSLERIQRAGRDMEAVIDAFLILAREGGVAPVSEEFDVREVALEEIDKAQALLAGKPVELALVGDAAPRLFAPRAVLGVVLRNLLRNACHFTERGRIEVEISPDAVAIRDTGIGMSAETLRHAFEPFYRADAFSPMGKGFGLTIANRLARRFGWDLVLESEPDAGTVATVRFTPANES